MHRQRTPHASSWSWTIGPANSNSSNVTSLCLKKDRFTNSLENECAVEEAEEGPPRNRAVLEPEPESTAGMATFEKRVFKLRG